MAVRRSVAAVVRKSPKGRKFAIIPHPRLRPPQAVGGGTAPAADGGALARMDVKLHLHACNHRAGVKFSLESLSHKG